MMMMHKGPNRTRIAMNGLQALAQSVDTLIVVPNQNLLALSTPQTTLIDAFRYIKLLVFCIVYKKQKTRMTLESSVDISRIDVWLIHHTHTS
jgi:cell division GTPase FtsZ